MLLLYIHLIIGMQQAMNFSHQRKCEEENAAEKDEPIPVQINNQTFTFLCVVNLTPFNSFPTK
jgi:hypothetical protein